MYIKKYIYIIIYIYIKLYIEYDRIYVYIIKMYFYFYNIYIYFVLFKLHYLQGSYSGRGRGSPACTVYKRHTGKPSRSPWSSPAPPSQRWRRTGGGSRPRRPWGPDWTGAASGRNGQTAPRPPAASPERRRRGQTTSTACCRGGLQRNTRLKSTFFLWFIWWGTLLHIHKNIYVNVPRGYLFLSSPERQMSQA